MPDEENEKRHIWPRTILKDTTRLPRMGRDFLAIAVELEEHSSGYRVVEGSGGKPKYQPLSGLTSFVQRFPVSRGLDHPNEIAAYMFADVFTQDYLTDDNETEHTTPAGDDDSSGAHQAKRLYVPFRPWCRKNLRLDWEG